MQNNLTILQWYDSIEEQNHRRSYAYGEIYNLIRPLNTVPSFQLIVPSVAGRTITQFALIPIDGNTSTSITTSIKTAGLKVIAPINDEVEQYDVIFYPDYTTCHNNNFEGQYYCYMTDGTYNWYSEIFNIVEDVSKYLKLQWLNLEDIEYPNGVIKYQDNFSNIIYIDSELGKPEYLYEEEVVKRDGYIFIEKQISDKKFKFEFAAPEYLCDALRLLKLHNTIFITYKGKQYTPITIDADVKWGDMGDIALESIEFTCDTVVKKIGVGTIKGAGFSNGYSDGFEN